MCAVSAVTDYYRDKWFEPGLPIWPAPQPQPYQPFVLKSDVTITQEQWNEYQELKRRMAEYDAQTNQPDCVKPEVAEMEKVIEDYLIKRGIIHVNK